ncbi:hypothetical protein [Pseudarthrobacter sp. NamE5]|uniref:hypothetical protein n=1 Tax=Pseudarthrobacter sp. NamE5 TaxID=2576839 RepID=UPI001485D729|nr:hypothetical protein [Pseudarthrobacter sp. NamE5]
MITPLPGQPIILVHLDGCFFADWATPCDRQTGLGIIIGLGVTPDGSRRFA